MEEYLEAVSGAGAAACSKIYDGTASDGGLNEAEMLTLAARFRELHDRPVGPIAMVMPREALDQDVDEALLAIRPSRGPVACSWRMTQARAALAAGALALALARSGYYAEKQRQ